MKIQRKRNNLFSVVMPYVTLIFIIVSVCMALLSFLQKGSKNSVFTYTGNNASTYGDVSVKDINYFWVYDKSQDMQMPELPKGSTATAASTLIRMVCNIKVSKQLVADTMPKSSWDFVNCYLGDPYTKRGFTCWVPCVKKTINTILSNTGFYAVDLTGAELKSYTSKTPFYTYVTESLNEPVWYSEDSNFGKGYKIARNAHAVVVTEINLDNEIVRCIDPLNEGFTTYSYSRFEKIFNEMGSQAVCILKAN